MLLLTGRSILAYAGMPRFKARLETLFMSGFQFVAFFMALVYSAVNLLPSNHPYTQSQNIGKFGIRHVIAEAANNLVFKKENIDQILLFVALLIGLVLVFMQIMLLAMGMFMQPVFAMPTNFEGFFITKNPTNDIAHIMLDMVFGVGEGKGGENLFGSCIAQEITCSQAPSTDGDVRRDIMAATTPAVIGSPALSVSIFKEYGFPFPIHTGMHQMFQLYNTGLLVVAAMITSYFIFTVVAETAQTGTAFGKRFNKVWAPLRIVFAFGMLVPVSLGFNGSQYAVLYAAKFGSGFATNGWIKFNEKIGDGYFGDAKDLISTPNIPEVAALLQFFFVAKTCEKLEEVSLPKTSYPTSITDSKDLVQMYLVKAVSTTAGAKFLPVKPGTSYQEVVTFFEKTSTVKIRFGTQHDQKFKQYIGSVKPICGEVILKLQDPRDPSASGLEAPEEGLKIMQEFYWQFLKDLWFEAYDKPGSYIASGITENYPHNIVKKKTEWEHNANAALPNANFKQLLKDAVSTKIKESIFDGGVLEKMAKSDRFTIDNLITEKGWAGAAIWYNRIAEMNGVVTTAILNVPHVSKYPDVMERIQSKKKLTDNNASFSTRFLPILNNGDPVQFREKRGAQIANALWWAFNFWEKEGVTSTHATPTGNAMIDSINAIFGTEGLYNIRRNPNTHPLAQIVGVGRSLIESSIRNLTLSVTGGATGKLLGFLDDSFQQISGIGATFLVTITMVAITAGFVLFYIVPFLPFIYFFFAVGGWIKGIFEAMVGAPLWALAHIRIDQNGLPGQAGVAGYFLIFEIFIRPILIIFGMLASISIFSALVSILHQVFDLVVDNVGGFDSRYANEKTFQSLEGKAIKKFSPAASISQARGAVDQFFFTIIYTVIIYLMAMSSFKLIDLIPNNILRWMGQSIATFNDQREDAAQGLVGKATIGAQQTSSALGDGLQKFVK